MVSINALLPITHTFLEWWHLDIHYLMKDRVN